MMKTDSTEATSKEEVMTTKNVPGVPINETIFDIAAPSQISSLATMQPMFSSLKNSFSDEGKNASSSHTETLTESSNEHYSSLREKGFKFMDMNPPMQRLDESRHWFGNDRCPSPKMKPLTWNKPTFSFGHDSSTSCSESEPSKSDTESSQPAKPQSIHVMSHEKIKMLEAKSREMMQSGWNPGSCPGVGLYPMRNLNLTQEEIDDFVDFVDEIIPTGKRRKVSNDDKKDEP